MPRRSLPLVIVMLVALVGASCGSSNQTPATSGGTGASAPPAASGAPGGSQPAGSGAAGGATGDLLVGAKYGCKPAPCEPDQSQEGVADEIAYVRYNAFAEANPDVSMTFTEADFDAQQFLTSVAAGNPPDVVRMDRLIMGTYIAQGALDPLDDCISSHAIDMSQYREPAVAGVTMNGSVYGIPDSYDSRIILVNDSVVEEAGLTPEDIDTSDWDKLKADNEKMLKKDGDKITRIGFDPKLPEFLPLWAKANGASIVSDDGKTSQLEDPKVAEALDFAVSLIKAHGNASDFFDFRGNGPGGVDFFGPDNQFAADTLGAFPMEQWYLNVLAENTPDEKISFVPFKDRQGNNISMSGGAAWAIPSSAKNKDAACEFVKEVTSPDVWFEAAKTRADKRAADGAPFTGVFTGNKAADDRIFGELVTEETAGSYLPGVQLVQETSDAAFSVPPIAAAEQFDRIWRDAAERVMNEGVPAADALGQADQEAQQAIDDAQ
ncbi:MAG TPA: extracellular solute-binding protein [Candidatus Limnocylindrales bacterium]|nr:extracellular solute-binding protein [Candidatus Limnocylindrales bacterium]